MNKLLVILAALCASLVPFFIQAQSVIQNPPRTLTTVRSAETAGDDSTLTANDAGSVSGNGTSFTSNPAPNPAQSSPGNGNPSNPPPPPPPAAPTYSAEEICALIGNRIPNGCVTGEGLHVFESPQVYTGGTFTVTINYNGVSQAETVTAGEFGQTSQTFAIGGGSFTVAAIPNITNNCPAANPAFAGDCLDRMTGTVTGP